MKNRKIRKFFTAVLLCFFLFSDLSAAALACTSMIVGKDASASGYPMFSRTEDSVSYSAKRFFVYPAGYYKKGQTIVDPSYGWMWTWTHDSYRMTATPDMPVNGPNVYDQAGINEHGFMMSTTNSTTISAGATSADPRVRPTRDPVTNEFVIPGGFAESLMNTVILGEAASSEEALTLWGKIAETDGMAEGCFWMLCDAKGELWITENCGGHRWVAARVPDDSFVVVANDMVIDYVDLADTKNFRGSADLEKFAADNGFAVYGLPGTPEAGKFNVAASYGQQNATGNTFRRWMGYNLFAPSQNIQLKRPFNAVTSPDVYPYPTFVKPDRKISALDIMEFQRTRYQGTPYDISETPMIFSTAVVARGTGSYVHMYQESETAQLPALGTPGSGSNPPPDTVNARPVGHYTQKETHVYEQIPEFPAEISGRWWFLEGQPEHSVNLPFYGNVNDTHPAYKKLVPFRAYDPESAFWIFRELSYLARSNRTQYGKSVHAYWRAYETKLFNEQAAITKELIERYNKDPKDAANWITDYTFATSQAAMNRAGLIRKALLSHIATNSGDVFVIPSDTIPFTHGTFDIHATSGDAQLTTSDIADVAHTLGISEWTIGPAQLKLPVPYPVQRFTPILYTTEDLTSGHPATLGVDTTVLNIPGVRVRGDLELPTINGGGNLMKVRYTAEIMGSAYQLFENSVENVKKAFSLHAMLPGYPNGFELVGPNGVVSLPDAIKTGKAWVIGDKDRATVMIDFYLYNDAGRPTYGYGGKIVVPDGNADGVLDTGSMWAKAYKIDADPDDPDEEKGCQVFPIGSLLGLALVFEVFIRRKSK